MERRKLSFPTLERERVDVDLGGKPYALLEADAAAGTAYNNAISSAAKFSSDGTPVGVQNLADAELYLLEASLFLVTQDGKLAPISLQFVKSLPNDIFTKLVQEVKDMSSIITQETEEVLMKRIAADQKKLAKLRNGKDPVKNSQSSTALTSA